mgnify:CR=1 FL=1
MSRTPPQAVLKGAASSTAMASPRAAHIFCCMAVSSLCAVSAAPHGAASNLLKIALRHQAVNKGGALAAKSPWLGLRRTALPPGVATGNPAHLRRAAVLPCFACNGTLAIPRADARAGTAAAFRKGSNP